MVQLPRFLAQCPAERRQIIGRHQFAQLAVRGFQQRKSRFVTDKFAARIRQAGCR
jgi:hypothetical protein